ncbi:hypothetical protein ES703_32267 [subsurface metagenome]
MENEDIKEWMNLHTKAIKGEIKASGDMLNFRINTIEKKIDNNHEVIDRIKKETLAVRLIHQHPKVSLFICLLIICGFIFLTNNIEIRDLLFFLKR